MTHPLVLQLRFTRSEFCRALDGVTPDEANRRFEPINSISWIIAHLTWQEQLYWLTRAQGLVLIPEINQLAAFGAPASNPLLQSMWEAWQRVTHEGDKWLDTLTTDQLTTHMLVNGQPHPESIGTMLNRMIYHYWYHTGESQAIRQLLGHKGLPSFVGNIGAEAPYKPEG